jgi:hypothetical protein
MWRRACLGSTDDLWTLASPSSGVVFVATLAAAALWGWWSGLGIGVAVGSVLVVTYAWRRRVWNGVVSRQAARGVDSAETWLRFQVPDA